MRDFFVFGLVCILVAATIRRPQVGILTWIWVSVMNPHKLSWGWLYNFPINDMVAIVTLLSCVVHWKNRHSVESFSLVKLIYVFYAWACLTTLFAVDRELSSHDWVNFTKTMLLVTLVLLFMNRKHWIIASISVFALSIGFVAIKGGMFTILTGGGHRVFGPPNSSWAANNSVSVAMLIIVPIFLSMRGFVEERWLKLVAVFSAVLGFAALLGTHSRGGLVGLLGMGAIMLLRSRKKLAVSLVLLAVLPLGFLMMPENWTARMESIANYEQDKSSMTRITQWYYAIDIANERPLFGSGFDAFFYQPYYRRYIASTSENRAVHSVYFQVLGEHGYIGLVLYLSIMATAIVLARKWSLVFLADPRTKWAAPFLEMSQFSIAGFAFNGLTVNLAYIDLYFLLLAFIILMISYNKQIALEKSTTRVGTPKGLSHVY